MQAEYRCPEPSCKRSNRGFMRLSNLRDHCRRVHRRDSLPPMTMEQSDFGTITDPDENSDECPSPRLLLRESEEEISRRTPPLMERGQSLDSFRQDMRSKLCSLQQQRCDMLEDIDRQISAVRKALVTLEKPKHQAQGNDGVRSSVLSTY